MILLSDLHDPIAFLKGARLPVQSTIRPDDGDAPEEWHWCVDFVIRIIRVESREFQNDHPSWYRELYTKEDVTHLRLALDPADPDVARWCDRKIAEKVARHRFLWAVLAITDDSWEIIWGSDHEIGRCGMDPLAGLPPCHPTNIPTARAALVQALHGIAPSIEGAAKVPTDLQRQQGLVGGATCS